MSQSKDNNDETIVFSVEKPSVDDSVVVSSTKEDRTIMYSPEDLASDSSVNTADNDEDSTLIYSPKESLSDNSVKESNEEDRTVMYSPEDLASDSPVNTADNDEDSTLIYSPKESLPDNSVEESNEEDRTVMYSPEDLASDSPVNTADNDEDSTLIYSPKDSLPDNSVEEPNKEDRTVMYSPEDLASDSPVNRANNDEDSTLIYSPKESLPDNPVNGAGDEDDRTIIYSPVKTQSDNSFLTSSIQDNVTSINLPKVFQPDTTIIDSNDNTEDTLVSNIQHREASLISNPSLQIGSILKNRFVLKKILGSGGMGTVFRATDLRRQEAQDQQSDVAIKVLNNEFKDDPELFIALQRETKKSQLLAHPNIVTVYDFDRDGHNVFMVMELLEGKTLSQFIQEECANGLSFKQAFHIIKGLSVALAYAHKKNIIHSDFKPGNVFITEEGDVKVLDFGIACAVGQSDKNKDETVFNARDLGALTPAYASLEMLQGKSPDPSDDVYALACVCYEILSGKHPYAKLSAQKALEVNLQVPKLKRINRRYQSTLNHALALRREDRTATINEFLNEIEPKSIWPKIVIAIAMIAILSGMAGYYYVFYKLKVVDNEIINLSSEQILVVKDFLELADIHFEVGFLTAPSGSNALWAYKQALVIDPYNQEAQKGLKKIASIIEQQARELYKEGHYNASLAKIEEGLEAVPKYQALLELQDSILEQRLGL